MNIDFKKSELSFGFRNPIKFVNQWNYSKINKKFRHCLIWFLYGWKTEICYVWSDIGIRIIGIEINYRKYLR